MSNAGYHAAEDGSLARSTGGAAARGAMLIAVALAIGFVLLAFALDDPATEVTAASADAAASDASDDAGSDAGAETDASSDGGEDAGPELVDPNVSTTDTPVETIPPVEDTVDVDAPQEGEILPAGQVNVLVANGTGGRGVAGGVADTLIADGYIAAASNAPATAAGVIYYKPGYSENAKAVAGILGAAPDVVQPAPDTIAVSSEAINDGRLDEANIVVIVGADNAVPPPA